MSIEFYRRLNTPLLPTNPRDIISAKHFFDDIQDRALKGSLENRYQSVAGENIQTRLGHVLMNEELISAETATEGTIRLIEEDYKDIVKNMTIHVEEGTAKLPKALFVLFLYNICRKHAEQLTANAILRLHISEGNGRLKGIVKIDGYGSGELRTPARLEEDTFFINPRHLDTQDLINMMFDAGHTSYITNYNDFSTGFQIGIHNFKKAHKDANRQIGQVKIVQ